MADENKQEQMPMDPELFKEINEGLREVFARNLKRDSGLNSYQQTWGTAAALAGQALIDLHSKFKPTR